MATRDTFVYPNIFGTLSGQVSASLLDQDFNAAGAVILDSAAGWSNFATDTGSPNAYVVTLNPPASEYAQGFLLAFAVLNANTGPSSINVNGLGSTSITEVDGSALGPQRLQPGTVYQMIWVNGAFRITSPVRPMIGEIKLYAPGTIPGNWLQCNGNAVSRITYSALFSLIGTIYGTGNGSTTYNLPNFTGRLPAFGSVGTVAGSNTTTLTVANLPPHNHAVVDPGHAHNYVGGQASIFGAQAGGSTIFLPTSQVTSVNVTGIQTANTGSGTAINNLPAVLNVNFIIRAL